MYCAKYFKEIYANFEKDYNEFDRIILDICSTLQDIFRRESIYLPMPFMNLFHFVSDVFIFILDNFIAVNLLSYFYTVGLLSLIAPVSISFVLHAVCMCLIYSVKDMIDQIQHPLKESDNLEQIDRKIETIFSEMNAIMIDGKVKKIS